MPNKPPICPAFAQAQSLTLSPIPEAIKSYTSSPIVSMWEDQSQLVNLTSSGSPFAGFDWTAPSSTRIHQNDIVPRPAIGILQRLDPSNVQQIEYASISAAISPSSQQLISLQAKLNNPTYDSVKPIDGRKEGISQQGLGIHLSTHVDEHGFLIPAQQHQNMSNGITPHNTPKKKSRIRQRTNSSSSSSSSFNVSDCTNIKDEGVININKGDDDANFDDKCTTGNSSPGDIIDRAGARPLHVWLKERLEQISTREAYENETIEALGGNNYNNNNGGNSDSPDLRSSVGSVDDSNSNHGGGLLSGVEHYSSDPNTSIMGIYELSFEADKKSQKSDDVDIDIESAHTFGLMEDANKDDDEDNVNITGETRKHIREYSTAPSSPFSTSTSICGSEEDFEEEEEAYILANEDLIQEVLVAECKRVSVRDACVIATLKRKSRLLEPNKEANHVAASVKANGANDDKGGEEEDEEDGLNENAMFEDRSAPEYSIFSPTSRLQPRRSVSFTQPEVTHIKTFLKEQPLLNDGTVTSTNRKNGWAYNNDSITAAGTRRNADIEETRTSHKRKASNTSLFRTISNDNIKPFGSLRARAVSTKQAHEQSKIVALSGQASSSDIGVGSNTTTPLTNNVNTLRYKRPRRSSIITSSLAFTSNSLTPIFSSAFMKGMNIEDSKPSKVTPGTLKSAIDGMPMTDDEHHHHQDGISEFGVNGFSGMPAGVDHQIEINGDIGEGDNKENQNSGWTLSPTTRPQSRFIPPPPIYLGDLAPQRSAYVKKKRSFGRTLSFLSNRG